MKDPILEKASFPNKTVTSKYTILTFIPLNFIHQVSKPSTLFFFITLLLVCIPKISPFEPFTYILAFSIIVGVSMVKDAMEDYNRHRDDDIVNKLMVKTIEPVSAADGGLTYRLIRKYCMELSPGDYLMVEKDEEIQADVVLLRSKKYHKNVLRCVNHCYLETSKIDGESNLKKRTAVVSPHCGGGSIEPMKPCSCNDYFFNRIASFELKDTDDSYSEFECEIEIDGNLRIASTRNVLLRGSALKNTEDSLCLVVGVGSNTKQSKSMFRFKKTKALFDERMNVILSMVLALFAVVMIITGVVGGLFLKHNSNNPYLAISANTSSFIKLIFSNYVIYTYMIPLSLYVILEIARFVHTIYIMYDDNMEMDGKRSVCRNSNAIQDLGVIDYVLSDKTGTLTQNSMTLKYIHEKTGQDLHVPSDLCKSFKSMISNETGGLDSNKFKEIVEEDSNRREKLMMIMNMLVCNSVEVLNGETEGISQEELCFLDSMADIGFTLCERDESFVVVKLLGTKVKMNIIGTLDFTSKRQRMAVIVELFGRYFLLEKGSDLMLLDKGRDREILKIINSSTDYRCLVMKYKELRLEEVEKFRKLAVTLLNDKSIDCNEDEGEHLPGSLLHKKQELEEESFTELERETVYLGSTFIEDKLEDQVQETVRVLKEAGIKMWMITGDKRETAITCAKNCCIIESNNYIALDGERVLSFMEKYVEDERHNRVPRVSSQEDLSSSNPTHSGLHGEECLEMIFSMPSVVIYRATPSQKGRIAALLVKSGRNTLSIGDGNNDLVMLKDSHVGVGIMGKEGGQAAQAADFAIPQFKCLKNLILLHGRYNFIRYTKIALNSYYKNIVFIFAQYLYNIYSGGSAFPLYNTFTLNYYNLFFTSLIPLSIVFFDRNVTPSQAIDQPSSYRHVRNAFDTRFIILNILFAILEGSLIFFMIRILTFNDITNGSGILGGYASLSTIFSIIVIFSVVLRQIRQVSYRVLFTDIAVALTIFLNLLLLFVIQELYNKGKHTIYHLLVTPQFYFTIGSTCSLIYALDTVYDNISLHLEERLRYKG